MNNKNFTLIIIFLIITTVIAFSEEKSANIFFINLFNKKLDIRLGESENPVFTGNNIDPFSSTSMVKVYSTGRYKLYFKKSEDADFNIWLDDGVNPGYYNIESGKSYCISINPNGRINYFLIEDDPKNGAKVCFINGTDSQLTKMQISKEWDKNIAVYTENINKNSVSNFVSFLPGIYALYWQQQDQKGINEYLYAKKNSGNSKLIYVFRENNYYIYLIYTDNKVNHTKLINISSK